MFKLAGKVPVESLDNGIVFCKQNEVGRNIRPSEFVGKVSLGNEDKLIHVSRVSHEEGDAGWLLPADQLDKKLTFFVPDRSKNGTIEL